MKKSRPVRPAAGVESSPTCRLPLVELLIYTEAELFELAVRSGLQVLEATLEGDRTAICGLRYAHQTDRTASRAGTVASEVVRNWRKVAIWRLRGPPGSTTADLPNDDPDRGRQREPQHTHQLAQILASLRRSSTVEWVCPPHRSRARVPLSLGCGRAYQIRDRLHGAPRRAGRLRDESHRAF